MYTKTNDISFNFLGKTVLFSAVAEELEKKYADKFASSGAIVYNASRTPCDIDLVIDLKCDLLRVEDIEYILTKLDDVDFVINVAGTNLCEPIENIDTE